MNALDLAFVASAAFAVAVGWRLGLVSVLMSLLSVVLGGAAGFLIARQIMPSTGLSSGKHAAAIMIATGVGILVGQLITMRPAQRIHDAVSETRLRSLNRGGGAAMTLGFGVVIVWLLATALALSPSAQMASLMRGSAVLVGLDRAVPVDAGPLFNQFESTVQLDSQPRVFTGLGLLPMPEVAAPDPDEVSGAARLAAAYSVVRIVGSTDCGATHAGSGAVIAPGMVLTNAHVVAGMAKPMVFPHDRRFGYSAVPVFFDPVTDLALLRVPTLHMPSLRLAADPGPGDVVAVAGYPNGGELQVTAARVRGLTTATGSNIYGEGQAKRQVIIVSGEVIPGDSGGPLLSGAGEIVGLTFAASNGAQTAAGYALTATQTAQSLAVAKTGQRVDTGSCAPS